MNAPQISLMVGSDTLGWEELGGRAILGEMTKGMPGGDGSLGFALYGDDAMKARNVLVPGDARVILRADGDPIWGGRVSNDPVRHRIGCQSVVSVACTGLYALAARDGVTGYIATDTDLERWRQYRGVGDHAGRFTVNVESLIELRASDDRTYAIGDCCQVQYLIHDGLLGSASYFSGLVITGIEYEYQLNSPSSNWELALVAGDDPAAWDVANLVWSTATTATGSWTPVQQAISWTAGGHTYHGAHGLLLRLTANAAGSPASDAWAKIRKVRVHCRWASTNTPDYAPTVGNILSDIAAGLVAAADVHVDATLAAYAAGQFAARYPTDDAEILRQLCALYTSPVEAWFDLDPASAAERFTARVQPADTALVENRLWIVGGCGGEDTNDLVRDWEATADQIVVLYACKDDATYADGTVRTATYPASTTATFPLIPPVDLTDKSPMTAAAAANYAAAAYAYRQANRYSGEVAVGPTTHDEHGSDVPTYKMKSGDRLTALDRDDTDRFGETLYVQGASFDWQSMTGRLTVGDPFDPLETSWDGTRGRRGRGPGGRRPHDGSYHVRTGVA